VTGTLIHLVLLIGVGVVAGVVSVVVSLASLVSYPALLAFGLPPVAANVSNTVALTFVGLGGTLGSRTELAGQRGTVLRLAGMSVLGGATGAALLLLAPGRTFELLAPWLIAGACIVLLVQPRLQLQTRFRPRGVTPLTLFALYAVAIYTGYFGAAGGVLTLVVLGSIIDAPLVRLNAIKTALAGVGNGVAALGFIAFGPVDWAVVIPLAIGFLVGGWIGPGVARRIPAPALRRLISGSGLAVAAVLGWRAYR